MKVRASDMPVEATSAGFFHPHMHLSRPALAPVGRSVVWIG